MFHVCFGSIRLEQGSCSDILSAVRVVRNNTIQTTFNFNTITCFFLNKMINFRETKSNLSLFDVISIKTLKTLLNSNCKLKKTFNYFSSEFFVIK